MEQYYIIRLHFQENQSFYIHFVVSSPDHISLVKKKSTNSLGFDSKRSVSYTHEFPLDIASIFIIMIQNNTCKLFQ